MDKDCLYASMRSMHPNAGEEVQWLAAERFLPRVDILANKNRLSELATPPPAKRIKLIMNGWYTERPKRFVPGADVDPLLVSMHIRPQCYKEFSKGRIREFLVAHGPVGCRDEATRRFLESEGIPSYFSGCLTLTLQRNPEVKQNGYVICVGLSEDEVDAVRKRTTREVMAIDRLLPMIYSQETRMDIARAYMALYQGAHCVVTKMLHVALPCLALGTPCLLVEWPYDLSDAQPWRYDGFMDIVHHVSSANLIAGNFDFDFDKPSQDTPNRSKYESLRDSLVRTCSAFTGFDKNATQITITDPLKYFLRILSMPEYYPQSDRWRILYYISGRQLVKAVWNRAVRHMTGHDLPIV